MKMKLHAVGESSTPLVNGLSIIIISYSALPCVLLAYQIRALLMSNRDVRYDTTVIGIPENTRGNIDTSALPKSWILLDRRAKMALSPAKNYVHAGTTYLYRCITSVHFHILLWSIMHPTLAKNDAFMFAKILCERLELKFVQRTWNVFNTLLQDVKRTIYTASYTLG